jgi:twitching motility two-component system response regulator PilH
MTGKQKILVVDDDATYRQLVTFGLTKAGYDVMMANDGKQALSWLLNFQQRPDLVLLDLLMPQLSGIEVLESIKTLPYKLPVILMSGAEWPIAREGVAQASPDAFLTKPFAMKELLIKIETLLQSISELN